ncbi:hypothetical protein CRE_13785 [Caenorhabditis remanei]|uniref:Uncharacterized protein n=1 Tax=Caenorhabditis remanei TaxID=31234 RepID=E3NK94_CAERE|nr:hypothetical protein CRE_13785 [Caenorhabditis remanei]
MFATYELRKTIGEHKWNRAVAYVYTGNFLIWGVLQNKVNAKPHSSIKALKKTLVKEWDAVSSEYLRATIDAYPRRLRAVIEKRGGRMEQV